MLVNRIQFRWLFPAIAIAAIAGCDSAPKQQPDLPDEVKMMIGPHARLVAMGKPTLNYHIRGAGSVTVIDQTSGGMVSYVIVNNGDNTLVLDANEKNVLLKDSKHPRVRQEVGAAPDPTHTYLVYFSAQ